PGEAARRTSIARAPAGCVCSTMTMASAPRGSGPPVAIGVAVPDSTGRAGATPQAITSSLSLKRTGAASLAGARSDARTAKPSTLERSNGGTPLAGQLARKQRGLEARQRLLAREDGQELLLIDALGALWRGVLIHLAGHSRSI